MLDKKDIYKSQILINFKTFHMCKIEIYCQSNHMNTKYFWLFFYEFQCNVALSDHFKPDLGRR